MKKNRVQIESLESRCLLSAVLFGVDDTGMLFNVTTSSGATTVIANTGHVMTDIAQNPAGNLFGVDAVSNLYTIDKVTAVSTLVGPVGKTINALGFAADGTLYGASTTGDFFKINTSTGAATLVGGLNGFSSAGDLAFDGAGNGYLSTTNNHLVSVNIGTGQTTDVGPIGFSNVNGLAFGSDGVLYGLSDNVSKAIFSINLSNGNGTAASTYSGITGVMGAATTPTAFAITVPTNVAATSTSASGGIRVSFTSVSGASSYTISRNTVNASGGATPIATGLTGNSFTDTTAVAGTTYFYFVQAVNGTSTSLFSASASATVSTAAATPQLTAAQVLAIVNAAKAVSLPSQTIVVVDRSGNVLAMFGQDPNTTSPGVDAILSNDTANIVAASSQDTAAKYAVIQATARARTAAFFESTQDAFTTRTARFIIGNQFPQGINNTEAGPLLGVEFSNALGTDALPAGITTGLAAGLSGDPGGVPLFINGQPVGGIGVAGDGHDVAARKDLVPTVAASPAGFSDPKKAFYTGAEEADLDEAVALAGAKGFAAPQSIQSTNIFVNGLRLPFAAEKAASKAPAANAMVLTDTGLKPANVAGLPARTFFTYHALIGDSSYLAAVPGATPNPAGTIAGVAPTAVYPLVTLPLSSGGTLKVFLKNNSPAVGGYGINAGITPGVGVVPTAVAGGAVTATAPAAFGFVPGAATGGQNLTISDILKVVTDALKQALITRAAIRDPFDVPAQVHVAVTDTQGNILAVVAETDATNFSFDVAVQKARTAAFFSSGTYAFSSRTVGFLGDSTIPPALRNGDTGPLYQLQETLGLPNNQGMFSPNSAGSNPLGNGITIFPGGAPLYKNGVLVGAVGISGDGVDQDDLICAAGTRGFRAAPSIQADALSNAKLTAALKTSVAKIAAIAGDVFPKVGNAATAGTLVNTGFADPDVPNRTGIAALPTDTILDRILKRLTKGGVDSVNLPFQKFPRNPEV